MLSEKLRSIRISLEDVQASQEDAPDILRLIRRELDAAAEQAENMETSLIVPNKPETFVHENIWEAMRDGCAD